MCFFMILKYFLKNFLIDYEPFLVTQKIIKLFYQFFIYFPKNLISNFQINESLNKVYFEKNIKKLINFFLIFQKILVILFKIFSKLEKN